MAFELEFRLALRPYEYVNVRVSSETMVTLSYDLDQLSERAREIYTTYDALYAAREAGGNEALAALQEGLGATVVEVIHHPAVPAPEDDVQPLWERPPAPAAQPVPVADVSLDDFDI